MNYQEPPEGVPDRSPEDGPRPWEPPGSEHIPEPSDLPAGGEEPLPPAPGAPGQPLQERPGFPFWGYGDLLVFVLLALPSLVVAAIVIQAIFSIFGIQPISQAVPLLAAQFLGYGYWFLALYLLLRVRYGAPFWESLAWSPSKPTNWAWMIVLGPSLALSVSILGNVLETPEIDMPMKDLLADPMSLILVGIFATTLGPLFEELAFRGFLMPLLTRTFGVIAGIVLSSLPFALLHGPQYAWSWRHVLLITLAGAGFGWIRYRTGSTAAATVVHAMYNLTFFAGLLFQGRGMPSQL